MKTVTKPTQADAPNGGYRTRASASAVTLCHGSRRIPRTSPRRDGSDILIDLAIMPSSVDSFEKMPSMIRTYRTCRFSSFLSPSTALTWPAAGLLVDLSPVFLTNLSFSSAAGCARPPGSPGDRQPVGSCSQHGELALAGAAALRGRRAMPGMPDT